MRAPAVVVTGVTVARSAAGSRGVATVAAGRAHRARRKRERLAAETTVALLKGRGAEQTGTGS